MQQVNINNVAYNVPISWDELTYSQAIEVIKDIDDKDIQLSKLTAIPLDIINSLQDKQVQVLFELTSFTENLEVFENDTVLEWAKDFDFCSVSYGDAEACRQILKKEMTGFEAIIPLIKKLKNIDISEMPFLEVIGTANFFLTKSMVSIIVTPSLVKVKSALSKAKRGSSDWLALGALERTLNSQKTEVSEAQ